MIIFLKNWCEGIIVAVIISIIIESILPEGNNKKYVKVIVGVYIIFTILNPLLQKVDNNIDLQDIVSMKTVETSTLDIVNVQTVYAKGIEENLKKEINDLGYNVKNIKINFDLNYENINEIKLDLNQKGISEIEKIDIGKNKKDENDYSNLKEYISNNYGILPQNIIIN